MKSHLPFKYQIYIAGALFILWQMGISFVTAVFLGLMVLFLFRKSSREISKDLSGVLAPVSGKVQSVIQEDGFIDIEIIMPWWTEMGIYLPFYAEFKNKAKKKGKKFFRYSFFRKKGERKGTTLTFENIKNEKKLEIFFGECIGGGGVHTVISPGDRGKQGASIGYFLLGGIVRLRFFSVSHELLVTQGERLVAGRTLLWENY